MGPHTIRIGALAPLTPPGWVEAGRHLLAGLELGVRDVNDAGGIDGRPLELIVRDTAGDPGRARAVVDELDALGAAALVGEFHSTVARAAAVKASALGIPFLCSSAVIDALMDEPTEWVGRLCPPQSRGWQTYADFLLDNGHRRVAAATEPSVYWRAGRRILQERLATSGGAVTELDVRELAPGEICAALADDEATTLLLLVGYPEPAVSIVKAVRADARLAGILIGAPAGQPEFSRWGRSLGQDGAEVPFLRYLPERLSPLGVRVKSVLRGRLDEDPSFVAFEGYDAVAVLGEAFRVHGTDRARIADAWPTAATEGSRGQIRFSRPPGATVWQWASPPIQIVDRDPADPHRFRILDTA